LRPIPPHLPEYSKSLSEGRLNPFRRFRAALISSAYFWAVNPLYGKISFLREGVPPQGPSHEKMKLLRKQKEMAQSILYHTYCKKKIGELLDFYDNWLKGTRFENWWG